MTTNQTPIAPEELAADRDKQRIHAERWRHRHRAKHYQITRKWKQDNLEKKRAHDAVRKALVRGKLQRLPCERCGATKRVHAHHDDYAKRLEVKWLCPLHHKERHQEIAICL